MKLELNRIAKIRERVSRWQAQRASRLMKAEIEESINFDNQVFESNPKAEPEMTPGYWNLIEIFRGIA